jgi:multiple RNA-binding domain-containing protein 1
LYGRRLVLEWADEEETVEELRRKTAEHFHDGEFIILYS